jgi:hypothetical protein
MYIPWVFYPAQNTVDTPTTVAVEQPDYISPILRQQLTSSRPSTGATSRVDLVYYCKRNLKTWAMKKVFFPIITFLYLPIWCSVEIISTKLKVGDGSPLPFPTGGDPSPLPGVGAGVGDGSPLPFPTGGDPLPFPSGDWCLALHSGHVCVLGFERQLTSYVPSSPLDAQPCDRLRLVLSWHPRADRLLVLVLTGVF